LYTEAFVYEEFGKETYKNVEWNIFEFRNANARIDEAAT
jgi:hypothetical protein